MNAISLLLSMPRYKVEYRERPQGTLLKASFINASNAEEAETEAKREFTAVQANLGARQYQILDAAALVVATHEGAAAPETPGGVYR